MNKLIDAISEALLTHWQVIVGGIVFYTGKDLLGAEHAGYWGHQIGTYLQDISLYVIGFKAVSSVYAPAVVAK
jgi:hypothetical protein